MDLAGRFDRLAKDNNISYWLYGGTLMGYARYVPKTRQGCQVQTIVDALVFFSCVFRVDKNI